VCSAAKPRISSAAACGEARKDAAPSAIAPTTSADRREPLYRARRRAAATWLGADTAGPITPMASPPTTAEEAPSSAPIRAPSSSGFCCSPACAVAAAHCPIEPTWSWAHSSSPSAAPASSQLFPDSSARRRKPGFVFRRPWTVSRRWPARAPAKSGPNALAVNEKEAVSIPPLISPTSSAAPATTFGSIGCPSSVVSRRASRRKAPDSSTKDEVNPPAVMPTPAAASAAFHGFRVIARVPAPASAAPTPPNRRLSSMDGAVVCATSRSTISASPAGP
jgi:hypothetical protein